MLSNLQIVPIIKGFLLGLFAREAIFFSWRIEGTTIYFWDFLKFIQKKEIYGKLLLIFYILGSSKSWSGGREAIAKWTKIGAFGRSGPDSDSHYQRKRSCQYAWCKTFSTAWQ